MPIRAEHCSAMSSVAPGVSLGHVPLSLGWHTAWSCTGSVERLLLLLNCVFCFLILTPVLSLGRGSIPPLGSQQYHGKAQIVFLHWPGEASHLLRCFLLVGCGGKHFGICSSRSLLWLSGHRPTKGMSLLSISGMKISATF